MNDGGCVNFCGGHHFRFATRASLCAAGRMRAVGRRCRPHGRYVVRELRGKSVCKPRIIRGLKNCRRTVMFFRRTMRSLLLIGRPTSAGLLFDGRWPRLRKDKNVTLPTGGTAGIFGLFRVRVCVSCGSLNVRRNGGCIAGLTTIKAI